MERSRLFARGWHSHSSMRANPTTRLVALLRAKMHKGPAAELLYDYPLDAGEGICLTSPAREHSGPGAATSRTTRRCSCLPIFPLLKRAHDDIVFAGGYTLRKVLILAAVFIAGVVGAAAQTYPTRVVAIIVPYPAGGPTETIARILAERMQ